MGKLKQVTKSKVLTAVKMPILVTSCSLVSGYRHFGVTYRRHLEGRIEAMCFSKTLVSAYVRRDSSSDCNRQETVLLNRTRKLKKISYELYANGILVYVTCVLLQPAWITKRQDK